MVTLTKEDAVAILGHLEQKLILDAKRDDTISSLANCIYVLNREIEVSSLWITRLLKIENKKLIKENNND